MQDHCKSNHLCTSAKGLKEDVFGYEGDQVNEIQILFNMESSEIPLRNFDSHHAEREMNSGRRRRYLSFDV